MLNLHRDEFHTLEGEARLYEDGEPTQEVICRFLLD
jgi:hypothetical protein